jgi:cytoplasmic iron level regulating protein YaaA (DUF328/UPF0246 family)
MLIVLSPAKTLEYTTSSITEKYSLPRFIERSADLIKTLRKMSSAQIASLMHISDPLAALNAERFDAWSRKFTLMNSKQAILAFNGDVYAGLDAGSLNAAQFDYAQSHIRILSGLYGVLRPLDLMQPYRLEMGTRLANSRGKDLYAFWEGMLTATIDQDLIEGKSKALINLASEEYFKAVQADRLSVPVITPVFEDWKGGQYKIISFYAKRARGLMARYATVNRIRRPERLKRFDMEGYAFDECDSTSHRWIFRRKLRET